MAAEGLYRGGLLLERAGAQHRSDDPRTPARHRPQRDLRLLAAAAPDDEQAPLRREHLEVEREVRSADELEDHVGTAD